MNEMNPIRKLLMIILLWKLTIRVSNEHWTNTNIQLWYNNKKWKKLWESLMNNEFMIIILIINGYM